MDADLAAVLSARGLSGDVSNGRRFIYDRGMSRIRVEFFGIPRQRAGIAETVLEFNGDEAIELRTLFRILTQQIPSLEGECLRDGQLSKGYIVNIDGQHFVSDSQGAVSDGAAVLIMSADAGG